MKIYKVDWGSYTSYGISAPGMPRKEDYKYFKLFQSKENAELFVKSIHDAARLIGDGSVLATATEVEVHP